MKVNIYLETDKQSQECMQRKYGYVIETIFKGTPITREGFGSIEGTYHKTNLQALIKALGHFHKECEVCVYTRDASHTIRRENILTQKKCTKFYTKWRYKDGQKR